MSNYEVITKIQYFNDLQKKKNNHKNTPRTWRLKIITLHSRACSYVLTGLKWFPA